MPAPKLKSRPRSRQSAISVPAVSRIASAILTARSAGSWIGTGSLKNTMIPTPENWSSVPSNWLRAPRTYRADPAHPLDKAWLAAYSSCARAPSQIQTSPCAASHSRIALFEHRVEYRGDIAARAVDGLQDLGGCCLL